MATVSKRQDHEAYLEHGLSLHTLHLYHIILIIDHLNVLALHQAPDACPTDPLLCGHNVQGTHFSIWFWLHLRLGVGGYLNLACMDFLRIVIYFPWHQQARV